MTIKLSINGREVEAEDGASVLDAINGSGTYISQLCKDPDMKPIGACRTCLVQIEGVRGFPASCSVPAADGMKVRTDTPEAQAIRKARSAGRLDLVSLLTARLALYEAGRPYREQTPPDDEPAARSY